MPQATDLTGLGMAPELARELGNTANALTCVGNSQALAIAGSAVVKTTNTELVTTSSSIVAAVLPSNAKVGTAFFFNAQATDSAVVYVPLSDYLNGSQNAGLTVAQHKGAIMWKYKISAGVGYWASILTA